jgi:hypothetical protein
MAPFGCLKSNTILSSSRNRACSTTIPPPSQFLPLTTVTSTPPLLPIKSPSRRLTTRHFVPYLAQPTSCACTHALTSPSPSASLTAIILPPSKSTCCSLSASFATSMAHAHVASRMAPAHPTSLPPRLSSHSRIGQPTRPPVAPSHGRMSCSNGGAISWTSKHQNVVALSTIEAAYVALNRATESPPRADPRRAPSPTWTHYRA